MTDKPALPQDPKEAFRCGMLAGLGFAQGVITQLLETNPQNAEKVLKVINKRLIAEADTMLIEHKTEKRN